MLSAPETTPAQSQVNRVRLTVDPELDKMFSAQVPARVKITTKSGIFEKTVADPKGEPTNAMDWGELVDKHLTVGEELIGEVSCGRMIKSVESFEMDGITPLQRMLRQKLHDHAILAFVEGA